jgi:hypothetical protein
VVKCIDCQYLSAISGETLPQQQREPLMSQNTDAFTWIACAKSITDFTHEMPQIFDQVLEERECKRYCEYKPETGTGLTWKHVLLGTPIWFKILIVIAIIILIAVITGAMLDTWK